MTFTVGLNYHYQNARDEMVKLKMIEGNGKWLPDRTLTIPQATRVGFTVEAAWAQYNKASYVFRDYEQGMDDVLGYQLRGL